MKRTKWLLIWCALCVALLNLGAQAEETAPAEAHKYTLNLIWIVGAVPRQFVWQIEQWPHIAFQSLASETLHGKVAELPPHSTIEYWSNDVLIGGEPSYEEVARFQEFCKNKAVNFIIHPGG